MRLHHSAVGAALAVLLTAPSPAGAAPAGGGSPRPLGPSVYAPAGPSDAAAPHPGGPGRAATGTLSTTVTDRATGKPYGDVEVYVRGVDGDVPAAELIPDAEGVVRSGGLAPGRYRLWVNPYPGGFGAQWVGERGGVGREHLAAMITVREGENAAAPPVLLDPAGSLRVTVLDPDGRPAHAMASAESSRYFDSSNLNLGVTDDEGRFEAANLGPYDWSLRFLTFDSAGGTQQWSGGALNPAGAATVRVEAGTTREWTNRLVPGTRVTGAVNPTADKGELRQLLFFDSSTGQVAAWINGTPAETEYAARVVGGTTVTVQATTVIDESTWFAGFHREARTVEDATPVAIPEQDAATIDLRFPTD
ncbi:hypothetical protein GCM10010123_45190 [Pilimelia anulata]|uniref:Carboxypeptidase regulatory-like domain-containing protein n=1 Tax=Pilimelia anulata TaxID=53371 RepID=A0A8J3BBK6_9ACTN|nr:hypothetical protein [Pilimelia anulata]GGK10190.1 hypothetical protein GCM10010123_45190 [Pilimelia anulata]